MLQRARFMRWLTRTLLAASTTPERAAVGLEARGLHASRCPGSSRSGKATATPTFYQALRNNDMLKDSTMGG